MESVYQVQITEQAKQQIREIARSIALELKDPDAALRLFDELESSISSLSRLPGRIVLTDEEPWRSQGLHRMPVKHYLVYFWINESEHIVHVTAVIYHRRDQKRQLSKMEMK